MDWTPVTRTRFIVFSAAVAALGVAELLPPRGWVPLLDGANLLFHEAGHPVFGLFGKTMALYGGTLGQLVFPLVVAVEFWRRRATLSFAVGSVWFFQNFFNIARYAADARAQRIPLVGGGEHDWWHILLRWRALKHDVTVGTVIAGIGVLGISAIWAWVAWRWLRPKPASATAPAAEPE
ncbi:MAG: hypothetical protein JXR37_17705 [Kiritimatiellae bacterium]|nr:hypothetical protein [Kiritimatiellia bacterium]